MMNEEPKDVLDPLPAHCDWEDYASDHDLAAYVRHMETQIREAREQSVIERILPRLSVLQPMIMPWGGVTGKSAFALAELLRRLEAEARYPDVHEVVFRRKLTERLLEAHRQPLMLSRWREPKMSCSQRKSPRFTLRDLASQMVQLRIPSYERAMFRTDPPVTVFSSTGASRVIYDYKKHD